MSCQIVRRLVCCLLVLGFVLLFPIASARAVVFTLKNGLEVSGTMVKISSIGTNVFGSSSPGGVDVRSIFMLDDGLRRTYFSTYQKEAMREQIETLERIQLRQPVARRGDLVGAVGPLFRSPTPFDEYGRRTISLMTAKGRTEVVQGITEITPIYTKVQGLQADRAYVWDMRIATSSIPRATLSSILRTHLSDQDVDERLSIVRLYLQARRFDDAEAELRSAIDDFPELKDLETQLRSLHQQHAQQRLDEIKLRRAAGQHLLATGWLQNFPELDVAGELLLEVRELIANYADQQAKAEQFFQLFDAQMERQPEGVRRQKLLEFRTELAADLNWDTLPRLASYLRLSDDDEMTDEQKLSLAISRWLLGTEGTDNLAVAMSLLRTRQLVRTYLIATDPAERQGILVALRSEEAALPKYVARIIDAMRPIADTILADPVAAQPLAADDSEQAGDSSAERPLGLFELETTGLQTGSKTRYIVQLPPEYHPYRRYPTIVTLHGSGGSPEQQLDWWCGSWRTELQMRMGQAARHGYIVIAPAWTLNPNQHEYKYSAAEHAAVFSSLRDAMRRFSVDSDRVFLSGHALGGDAAWDIGLAHPDTWAGVIPIAAMAEYTSEAAAKYIGRSWENARYVPMMFVAGALDVARISANARDLNRYLTHNGIDVMVVEYLGRGREHFQDEIHRIFDWMELHRRDFYPREFAVHSLRPWDNFYWWLEFSGVPRGSMILPLEWPNSASPMKTRASARDKRTLIVSTGAARATLWLSPELIDLDQRLTVSWKGRRKRFEVSPELEVMLEDVRLRGDRQHPFWAKIEVGDLRAR